MSDIPNYRVFLSYSHGDEELVVQLEKGLLCNNITPMRDKQFAYGVGFHEQIRRFIEYSHVFVPLITKRSSKRGWVHQEIGYAIAQNIPVLPILIQQEPRQWLQMLHAITLKKKVLLRSPEVVKDVLSVRLFDELVSRFKDERNAMYFCGLHQEDRTRMLAQYSADVASIQALLPQDHSMPSMVRQKGALSSFQIPVDSITARVWKDRSPGMASEHLCRLQRQERLMLTQHAERWGCRLIIEPFHNKDNLDDRTKLVRLKCLSSFLKSKSAMKTEVAIRPRPSKGEPADQNQNVTIVGNWFLAFALNRAAGTGYNQTNFTRHAPSIQSSISDFDDEFFEILKDHRIDAESSRQHAVLEIDRLIEGLDGDSISVC